MNKTRLKLLILDLDGVLIDSKENHFDALNDALAEQDNRYVISKDEHLSKYDALPTTKKLELLTAEKGLPKELYNIVWKRKQEHTITILKRTIKKNYELIALIKSLIRDHGLHIAVASNSIGATINLCLDQLGISDLIDVVASNEGLNSPKPYPEMYWNIMSKLKILPKETLIIEDSHIGRKAALDSGAFLLPVENPSEVTKELITNKINELNDKLEHEVKIPWIDKKLNIVIPMSGAGSRFEKAGYTFPKPLIDVRGKPMIQVVVENLNMDANYIFIVQREHYEKYNLKYLLTLLKNNCKIVIVDGLTEGAACSVLLAKKYIDNDNPLVICNSDQFIEWNSNEAMYAFAADSIDGGILTFKSTHPKWSFVRLDDNGFVAEVAEKKVISDIATVGLYFWKKGSDFVKSAEEMINAGIKTNGEYYIAPTFQQMVNSNKKIKIKMIDNFFGLGTPEDLNYFLDNYKGII